jgi:hypothetical protein
MSYADRNFIIETKDKTLFTLMKVIVDAGFPPLDDIRCVALRIELYKRKRIYAYRELESGSIYIHFPRANPFRFVYAYLKYYLWDRYQKDDDNDDGGIYAQ